MPNFKNSIATFWVIFKHCAVGSRLHTYVSYIFYCRQSRKSRFSLLAVALKHTPVLFTLCTSRQILLRDRRGKMKKIYFIFVLVYLFIPDSLNENVETTCRRNLKVALQAIFREHESNNTICVSLTFY